MSLTIYGANGSAYGSAIRGLYNSSQETMQSMEKLSTGKKINSAEDDIAGLSLAGNLEKIASLTDIVNLNAQTGLNMLETAEDALGGMVNVLQQIRSLSLQAANGVYAETERKMLQDSVGELEKEIQQAYISAKFGDRFLFSNQGSPVDPIELQIGSDTDINSRITIDTSFNLGSMDFSVTTVDMAKATIDLLDSKIQEFNDARASLGAQANKVSVVIDWQKNKHIDYANAKSTIMDTDMAKTSGKEISSQIKGQFAATVFQQTKNMNSSLVMQMYNNL